MAVAVRIALTCLNRLAVTTTAVAVSACGFVVPLAAGAGIVQRGRPVKTAARGTALATHSIHLK
jgi:hypothetical protein